MSEFRILVGDALEQLRTLPDESVQCCVTSPPYWGLRDYGVPGQQGLEASPDEYVARMVSVFREVRRVLRADGTAWVNMGDSYCSVGGVHEGRDDNQAGVGAGNRVWRDGAGRADGAVDGRGQRNRNGTAVEYLKPKDLIGVPWLLAFALRADGWYLRQDIIWHKPNPMPESVRDRCTKSHEHIFLLSKSARYYYDADAISEDSVIGAGAVRNITPGNKGADSSRNDGDRFGVVNDGTRNKRDVWTISTKPSGLEHFAAFPPELPETCIRAGTKPGDLVLDPFSGTGTTGIVAVGLGRRYIGIELNPKYAGMSETRYREARGLFSAPVS